MVGATETPAQSGRAFTPTQSIDRSEPIRVSVASHRTRQAKGHCMDFFVYRQAAGFEQGRHRRRRHRHDHRLPIGSSNTRRHRRQISVRRHRAGGHRARTGADLRRTAPTLGRCQAPIWCALDKQFVGARRHHHQGRLDDVSGLRARPRCRQSLCNAAEPREVATALRAEARNIVRKIHKICGRNTLRYCALLRWYQLSATTMRLFLRILKREHRNFV